ncbi:MAG: hypothetical protein H6621_03880 [Halobacteriovoraceae bacterium]|nr:hypothetical protein [Halobacteriovoraceae bacterium]
MQQFALIMTALTFSLFAQAKVSHIVNGLQVIDCTTFAQSSPIKDHLDLPIYYDDNMEVTLRDYMDKEWTLKIHYDLDEILTKNFEKLTLYRIKNIEKYTNFQIIREILIDRDEAINQIENGGEYREFILELELRVINDLISRVEEYKAQCLHGARLF